MSASIPGDKLLAGDDVMGFGVAADVTLGRLPAGARFADVRFDDGSARRCWAGFYYHVLNPRALHACTQRSVDDVLRWQREANESTATIN